MASKYHIQLRNKDSEKIFKLLDPTAARNKVSKEMFKEANKPKKRFNRGGKV